MSTSTQAAATLATRLRDRRLDLGLTQAALGQLVGSSASLAGQWERGAVIPTAAKLERLAAALYLPAPELHRLRREALT